MTRRKSSFPSFLITGRALGYTVFCLQTPLDSQAGEEKSEKWRLSGMCHFSISVLPCPHGAEELCHSLNLVAGGSFPSLCCPCARCFVMCHICVLGKGRVSCVSKCTVCFSVRLFNPLMPHFLFLCVYFGLITSSCSCTSVKNSPNADCWLCPVVTF